MASKDLYEYVARARAQKMTDEEIRRCLLAAGWDSASIDEGLGKPRELKSDVLKPGDILKPGKEAAFTPAEKASGQEEKNKPLVFGLTAVLILAFIGGSVYAYVNGVWPFAANLSDEELVSKVFEKFSEIETATYFVSLAFESQPRDPGALPLELAFPEFEADQILYDRDESRFRDIRDIQDVLKGYNRNGKDYPLNLGIAGIKSKDPLTGESYKYSVDEDGKDYSLEVTFETQEAIDFIERLYGSAGKKKADVTIDGKTVVLNKDARLYSVKVEPRKPFFVKMADQGGFLSYLPGDINIVLEASGTARREADENTDTKFQLGADVNLSDLAVNVDVEFLKKDSAFYVRLNKFPGLFFDVSAIKNKWIKILPEDLSNSDYFGYEPSFITNLYDKKNEESAKILEQVQLFFKLAKEEKVIVFSGPHKETLGGKKVNRYSIALKKENLAPFYRKLVEEFKARYGEDSLIKFDEKTASYLEGASFENLFEYLRENNSFDIWIDPKEGFPVKFAYSFRLVPGESEGGLSDKQFLLSANLELSDINKKIDLKEPSDFLTFEDASIALTGITKAEYLFGKQTRNISGLRRALELYNKFSGSYPDSLEDLKMTGDEVRALNPSPPEDDFGFYKDEPLFLFDIPKDAFTNKAFEYAKGDGDYSLVYMIEFPPLDDLSGHFYSFYEFEKYIEGKNTASKNFLSVEADAASKKDADKDGLPDYLEAYYGTDKNNPDTDGDGTNDGVEVKKMDNPSGPGKL